MAGKIFKDSANIIQDQAKVLFDYYRKAAETIVSEQVALENRIADWKAQEAKQSQRKKIFLISCILSYILAIVVGVYMNSTWEYSDGQIIFASGIFLILGIILTVLCVKSNKRVKEAKENISKSENDYKNIRTDYGVNKIGVVYVPVATRVPFEGKSFLIDHTKKVADTEFKLTVLNKPEEFKESLAKLKEGMKNIPIVENNEMPEEVDTSNYSKSIQNVTLHDYAGNIDRHVRNINYLLNDNSKVSVSLPIIAPNTKEAEFIEEYSTDDIGNKPVVKVFSTEGFDEKVKNFANMNAMKDSIKEYSGGDNSEYMKDLMVQLADTVQLLTKTKTSGSSKLVNYTTKIFENTLKSAYNEYSPSLEAEEIERIRTADFDFKNSANAYKPFSLKQSSRVRYDLFSGNWMAEDGSRTSMPFGMHQIDEEVFMPVIQNLMEENRVERLKIYNNIEDQKRNYLERWTSETGEYFRDNRKAADELINRMREAYADYTSSATTYKALMNTQNMLDEQGLRGNAKVQAVDAKDEIFAGFEIQAAQCNKQQEEFSAFMDRIQDDINDSKKRFSRIEYFEAILRDKESQKIALSLASVNELEPRKKQLIGVSPYFANNAELPPMPSVQPNLRSDIDINLKQQVNASLSFIEGKQVNAPITENNDPITENNDTITEDSTPITENNTPVSENNTLTSENNTANNMPSPASQRFKKKKKAHNA